MEEYVIIEGVNLEIGGDYMEKDKKFIGFCIFILMLIMTSCSNKQLEVSSHSEQIPTVRVGNHLYWETGEHISLETLDLAVIGVITSEVANSEIPVKNDQSNFGYVGAQYASYEGGIAVMINDQWQLFRKEKLTLEKVIDLSHKKQELSWNDFDRYDSKEIGSGLYILRYEIEEGYYLLIGGNHPTQKPLYIKLIQTKNPENYIDIRKNSVEEFISKN